MTPVEADDFPICDAEIVRRAAATEPGLLFGATIDEARRLHDWSRCRPLPFDKAPDAFALFIGYPRSGHSLIGALLDAHPEMAISHELDVLKFRAAGFSPAQVLLLIAENSRRLGRLGRRWANYDYGVPGAWQGRWQRLRVIGDKRGGETTKQLRQDPRALDAFERFIGLPLRFIHVVRHPADNVATMVRRSPARPGADLLYMSLNHYGALAVTNAELLQRLGPERSITLYHEDFLAAPEAGLSRLCAFLGVEAPPDYLAAAAARVQRKPSQTRNDIEWSDANRRVLGAIVRQVPFLHRYAGNPASARGA